MTSKKIELSSISGGWWRLCRLLTSNSSTRYYPERHIETKGKISRSTSSTLA
jgi:hypothetical protein